MIGDATTDVIILFLFVFPAEATLGPCSDWENEEEEDDDVGLLYSSLRSRFAGKKALSKKKVEKLCLLMTEKVISTSNLLLIATILLPSFPSRDVFVNCIWGSRKQNEKWETSIAVRVRLKGNAISH
ncbi:hypothetical protein V3C99_002781 [Haemonchus contortus]|uniref:Secreted protein n=1 Tax=Haemonchus contortus TaxID=6289 RepID=A0A7I4Y9X6_HAECO